jgi:hypothetical protein
LGDYYFVRLFPHEAGVPEELAAAYQQLVSQLGKPDFDAPEPRKVSLSQLHSEQGRLPWSPRSNSLWVYLQLPWKTVLLGVGNASFGRDRIDLMKTWGVDDWAILRGAATFAERLGVGLGVAAGAVSEKAVLPYDIDDGSGPPSTRYFVDGPALKKLASLKTPP